MTMTEDTARPVLARTGPGTPMGAFMRRFWIPVHRAADLAPGAVKPLRIMSEDFALYSGARRSGADARLLTRERARQPDQSHCGGAVTRCKIEANARPGRDRGNYRKAVA